MKIETSPVLVLDSFTALRSKSYSFSYNSIQKAKQKGIQKAPECEDYTRCLFMSEQQVQQIIQLDLIYTN